MCIGQVDPVAITIVIAQVAQVVMQIRGCIILVKLNSGVNLTKLDLTPLLHAPIDDWIIRWWHMDVFGNNLAAVKM